ncbi:MAG: hypothetical protein WCP46_00430 [Alphaproteobacteria bacterium]
MAKIQGDDATAKAEKAFRQADSAIRTQVNSLKGDVIAKEDAVTEAQERQAEARINNGQPITNRDAYVRALLDAKNAVTKAEQDLEIHNAKIAFLESELEALTAEVEQA